MNYHKTLAAIISGGFLIYLWNEALASPLETNETHLPLSVKSILATFSSEVGVKETGGANRGPRVEEYQKAGGGKPGDAWCSGFIRWVLNKAGIRSTVNIRAATAFNPKNVIYQFGKVVKAIQPGDVFTLYSTKLGRINHAGFIESFNLSTKILTTVEGNYSDGVYRVKRPLNTVHDISRWA